MNLCPRCNLPQFHLRPADCIAALRAELGAEQLRNEGLHFRNAGLLRSTKLLPPKPPRERKAHANRGVTTKPGTQVGASRPVPRISEIERRMTQAALAARR